MALKDWRQLPHFTTGSYSTIIAWRNIHDRKKEIGIQKYHNDYSFLVVGESRKEYLTKAQAMAFAKQYMRSH